MSCSSAPRKSRSGRATSRAYRAAAATALDQVTVQCVPVHRVVLGRAADPGPLRQPRGDQPEPVARLPGRHQRRAGAEQLGERHPGRRRATVGAAAGSAGPATPACRARCAARAGRPRRPPAATASGSTTGRDRRPGPAPPRRPGRPRRGRPGPAPPGPVRRPPMALGGEPPFGRAERVVDGVGDGAGVVGDPPAQRLRPGQPSRAATSSRSWTSSRSRRRPATRCRPSRTSSSRV